MLQQMFQTQVKDLLELQHSGNKKDPWSKSFHKVKYLFLQMEQAVISYSAAGKYWH